MVDIITTGDLPADITSGIDPTLLETLVAGLNARAARIAPCLASTDPAPSDDQVAEAKLILLGAIKRWSEAGAGAFQSQTAGPFSVAVDTRQRGGYNLWPSEITALQDICGNEATGAFSVDTAPVMLGGHRDICALNFGAAYCSCGADIAGFPLYEGSREAEV